MSELVAISLVISILALVLAARALSQARKTIVAPPVTSQPEPAKPTAGPGNTWAAPKYPEPDSE